MKADHEKANEIATYVHHHVRKLHRKKNSAQSMCDAESHMNDKWPGWLLILCEAYLDILNTNDEINSWVFDNCPEIYEDFIDL